MEFSQEQYERISDCFPKPRGKLRYNSLEVLNAIPYIAENGAKWRRFPDRFGRWHTIYSRMRHWAKIGVLARVFEALQHEQIIHFTITVGSWDSTSVKVHPDGTGALKNGPQAIGRSRGGLTTKIHLDHELYKSRNEVERLFRMLKGFRRIFSRFEKLDLIFTAFI
ncbi:MAG: transposase [Verrucomicrobiota bacterium JB024]|nr:transposase [Verrucomicrobiota bacterium JB024]